MRDTTGPSGGWLLAFGRAASSATGWAARASTPGMPIEDGPRRPVASPGGHEERRRAALYVDGVSVHTGTGADSTRPRCPWHVMRNGTNNAFSEGEADEVAIYTRALTAQEAAGHHALGRQSRQPAAARLTAAAAEPPFAGVRAPGGGVLASPSRYSPAPRGSARVRRGLLVVRGAAGTANRLVARRRGPVWRGERRAAALSGRRRLPSAERARRDLPRLARQAHRDVRRRRERPAHGDRPDPLAPRRRARPRPLHRKRPSR